MTVEVLWPETAPWWLNLFIWMAYSWQYILAGFIPAFYIAIVKLFGFPLHQRWQQEVVVMVYANKVKFSKISEQFEPYFRKGKGIYWLSARPLQPEEHEVVSPKYQKILDKMKEKCEELAKKELRTEKEEKEMQKILQKQMQLEKRKFVTRPVNTLHIFSHAVNQPVYDMTRRTTKTDEILFDNAKLKNIKSHGIWLMQGPKVHFHRHYLLLVAPDNSTYKLIPVKERQQFAIGFWHSIGISLTSWSEIETHSNEGIGGIGTVGSQKQKQLMMHPITTHMVLQQMRAVQEYHNFSASRAYNILKLRKMADDDGIALLTGKMTKAQFLMLAVMIGGIASIGLMMYYFHGSTPPATGTPPARSFLGL